MKVSLKLVDDSHNTDTEESIDVAVKTYAAVPTMKQVEITLPEGRVLSLWLEEFQYVLNQPSE